MTFVTQGKFGRDESELEESARNRRNQPEDERSRRFSLIPVNRFQLPTLSD
jgi:hypothetical protein